MSSLRWCWTKELCILKFCYRALCIATHHLETKTNRHGSAQLRTICQNIVRIMDYKHKNANFEAIFITLNINRLKYNQNFFCKCGHDLQLFLKVLYPILNYMKILLLISKTFVKNFDFPGCASLMVAKPPYKPFFTGLDRKNCCIKRGCAIQT